MSEAEFTREERLFARCVQQYPSRPFITWKGLIFATGWIIPVLILLGMRGA